MLPDVDIDIVDESWDQTRYLARVRPPNEAGRFLLIDMETDSVQEIGPEYDHLAGFALATTELVRIESSTSGSLTAHLTLPNAADGPVPAVVIPRSLPTHEDVADPHYLVEFLAASGYAVLRVQNRVEPEYGLGWTEERAMAGWRQSASDIRDAANYLVETGISSADTMCAIGKDYGAYVAVMTTLQYPGTLNCIVSIGGIFNLQDTRGGVLLDAAIRNEGTDPMTESSPIRRADELEVPVLMFHGRGDWDVDITKQSQIAAAIYERADKDVFMIEYPNSDHSVRPKPDRIDMLTRSRGFLAEHIGPALGEAESASADWRVIQ
jgi:dipeptidyl aminopeptidase/acylaminoacyl peptidase